MKVLTINGLTKSGKTTTAEHIITELKRRGYSVGSVKEIHYEKFSIDVEGTNTDRHKKAGSSLVTARGMFETDVMFPEKLHIEKILSFYDHDYCILEGVSDINAPLIITAHNTEEIDARLDYRTLAVSGVIANGMTEYKGYPVINCIYETYKLVDLIECSVPELVPDFDADCCAACGYGCHELLKRILAGESRRDDCIAARGNISLKINGRQINMVPFVQNILRNAVIGVAGELDGYSENAAIEIEIDKK